jgi:predicted N-acyltransferase
MPGDFEPKYDIRLFRRLADIGADAWRSLGGGDPFLSWEYLSAMHETGCAAPRSGWTPSFLTLWKGDALQGAMPLYLKAHSWGEFVFDWAWAEAYQNYGHNYYPKLLCAVPFTPVSGMRLLASDPAVRPALARAAIALAAAQEVSSLHVLFPTAVEAELLQQAGCMLRTGIQFHWSNDGYADFDGFLATLTHAKRKKIRQERRKVAEAGIAFQRLTGDQIGPQEWAFFYRCYCHTYREHMSSPYLNLEFFKRLGATMPQHLLLALATRDGEPIGASLCVFDSDTLWGRYWGAVEFIPCLHFDACYYQPIEFCIERRIKTFEGGAQGEHKLARGFLPVVTRSAHWLARPEFADAVERFLERETAGIAHYVDELNEHAPFRRPD